MYSDLFSASSVQDLMAVLPSLPYAIWETFYVTVLSTLLSLVLGLPLGVLLVAGEKNGVLPLPRWLLQVLNVIINLLGAEIYDIDNREITLDCAEAARKIVEKKIHIAL